MLDRVRKWLKPEPVKQEERPPQRPILYLQTRVYCPQCGQEITNLAMRTVVVQEPGP